MGGVTEDATQEKDVGEEAQAGAADRVAEDDGLGDSLQRHVPPSKPCTIVIQM